MADKQAEKTEKSIAPIIVIKKKKGSAHAGHHGGSWKVAYADFMTAMMAFFLVMWLMGTDEETKAAIESYFKDPGRAASGALIPEASSGGGSDLPPFAERSPAGGQAFDMPAGQVNVQTTADHELLGLKEILEETISVELGMTSLSEKPEMTYDSQGLVLRIAVKDFFAEGEVEPREDLRPVAYRIGKILSSSKHLIRVEGHTDRTEANPTGYPTAWELSAARAGWVAKFWLKSFPSLSAAQLQVAGNSHHRPLSDSITPEGRASNRRVEIIVLNSKFQAQESPNDPASPAAQ